VAEKKMTNIRLDPALWARVKAAAGQRGITLERWVSEALETNLQRDAQAAGEPAPGDGRTQHPAEVDGTGAPGAPGGSGAQGVPADALQALHWRVEALEQAVDYLAGIVGAGFPRRADQP
jgi:hypothetical protein